MADVFAVLMADHLEVKEMLTQLESPGSGGKDRAKLAERLVMEESKHEAVEEMYFWPSVRENVAGGDQLADKALEQEDEGKDVLDQLRKASAGEPEFERLVTVFARAGREHIAYEEEQVWPKLRAVLSPEECEELGDKIEQAKKAAPTRPHPNAPDSPGALKSAGVAAAVTDRVRDAVSGRG